VLLNDARFPREARLLTPKDYKTVFDDAPFRASCPEVLVLARWNDSGDARLGIVVGKKHCRFAHQRNRIKRLCREAFRHHRAELAGLDMVILARKNIALLDNASINATLTTLWERVLKKSRSLRTRSFDSSTDGC